jgi:hypothetical protein
LIVNSVIVLEACDEDEEKETNAGNLSLCQTTCNFT